MTQLKERLYDAFKTLAFIFIVGISIPFVAIGELLWWIRDHIGCTLPRGGDHYWSHDHRLAFWTWSASH